MKINRPGVYNLDTALRVKIIETSKRAFWLYSGHSESSQFESPTTSLLPKEAIRSGISKNCKIGNLTDRQT